MWSLNSGGTHPLPSLSSESQDQGSPLVPYQFPSNAYLDFAEWALVILLSIVVYLLYAYHLHHIILWAFLVSIFSPDFHLFSKSGHVDP